MSDPNASAALTRQHLIYADLLDNLRARVKTAPLPCVVVAGITATDSVASVIAGLTSQAESRGLKLLVGELVVTHGSRVLRRYEASATGDEVEGTGRPAAIVLKEWLDLVGAGHDLILIVAPPVQVTVETALLGKAGDGLLLVVHPFATPRAELRGAARRSETAGCKVLGVVMNGSDEALPRWIRQIIETLTG